VKKFNDLSEEEQTKFLEVLSDLILHGEACIVAASQNANEDPVGWPPVSINDSEPDSNISMCSTIDILYQMRFRAISQSIAAASLVFGRQISDEKAMKHAIHAAMHDAFALGISLSIMCEMDFQGADTILENLNRDESDGWEHFDF
jgi:hypothetical protein